MNWLCQTRKNTITLNVVLKITIPLIFQSDFSIDSLCVLAGIAAEPIRVGEFCVGRAIREGRLIGGRVNISSAVPQFYGVFGGKRYIFSSEEIEVILYCKNSQTFTNKRITTTNSQQIENKIVVTNENHEVDLLRMLYQPS